MQRLVLSTDDVPETERFAYWRETVGEAVFGVSPERDKARAQETSFNASLDILRRPSFVRLRGRTPGCPVFRRPGDIARLGHDRFVWIHQETGAGLWFKHDGREFVTKPGDLLVADLTLPFAAKPQSDFSHDGWWLPRRLFDPHLPASLHLRSLVLSGRSGLAGIVKGYLEALDRQVDALDDREAGFIADHFCRLLAVACGAAAGEHKESIRLAQLERAKRYIGLHLTDPELTPEKAAGALGISARQLHVLFEPSGTSFSRYVLSRRLEECRAALMDPVGSRSVTDVAFAWGFNSLATFNRTFRKSFDIAPSELRPSGGRP
jgi:AraC-like DNA-binding protein